MKPGYLIKHEDYDGEVSYGYVLYIDVNYNNEVYYHIRWSDGSETDVYESEYHNNVIQVIQ